MAGKNSAFLSGDVFQANTYPVAHCAPPPLPNKNGQKKLGERGVCENKP